MIQRSVSDSLDCASSDAVGTDQMAPPAGLFADGLHAARADDERIVATVASSTPMLGWKIGTEFGPTGASSFEVEVHDSSRHLVWTSGTVASTAARVIVGRELAPHSAYDWRVRVADHDGQWSPWATSTLETGPFRYSDWQSQWLSISHLLRLVTPFRVSRPVAKARLYLTGQGVIRAWVNGAAINPDRMDPTRTDFVRALFRSYDVTDSIAIGENELSFVAGLGEWARTGESPRLLAELMLWHDDGSISRIAPGVDSDVTLSEITVDEPFYLERHDSHAPAPALAVTPLAAPIILEAAALPASATTPPTDVSADPTPPLRTVQKFDPTEIGRSGSSRLFDVGVNIAGRSKLVLQAKVPKGTVIQVLHGEHVGDDGHIDTTNLTMPYDQGRERQLVEYVANGVAGETHEPWFTYFGFRYLEVRGLPDDAIVTVTAYSMHTDLTPSGSLSTDSPTVDRLLTMAARTLLNNVHGVPEDCPTREQAAWTGDTASVAEYELAAFDSASFLDKWIADLETSQQPDGQLPAVSPDLHPTRMPSDPVWGSALHRMLRGHLLHYGDFRLIQRALPALRRWADFQLSCADDDGIISRSPISYGHDWLALEQTPPPIHHTGAAIDCLLALADLEEATGDPDAAAHRRLSADGLRASARRVFFDPATGTFGNGSQGSYAIAIDAGVLTGREADAAGDRLVDLVRERGNRVSSGFATTRSVVRALTALGRSQVIYDILLQSVEPGVGAMLNSGPGTFWECWWIDPSNTGTGSLNHVGLGGPFAAWAWEGLAGLRPTAPGYTRFRLEPQFIDGVSRLELRTETVRGEVAIGYSRIGSRARLEITVPPGSEGTVAIAGRPDALLTPGRHVIEVETPEFGTRIPPRGLAVRPARSIAPVAADVIGSRTLLTESEVVPGRANPTVETLAVLRCMPIPHEQPDHAVLKVVSLGHSQRDTAPTVMLKLQTPLPIVGISFFYALIDQCLEGPEQVAKPFLQLHLNNGETLESTSTGWPAGWNRVAVDSVGVADEAVVVAIEVGLKYGEEAANNALAVYPSEDGIRTGFHLSEVGFSTMRRTW
ncbi:MAG TPA: family 78 glycoside hydrolase catalytic domain [Microbacteriaceae bacterium]